MKSRSARASPACLPRRNDHRASRTAAAQMHRRQKRRIYWRSSIKVKMAGPLRHLSARRLANDAGIDLDRIGGTGPGGRIQKKDVIAALQSCPSIPETIAASRQARPEGDCLLNAVWLRKGEGTPLVLLHGFASDHNNWRGLLPAHNGNSPCWRLICPPMALPARRRHEP